MAENGKNTGNGKNLEKQEAPKPNNAERFTALVMRQFGSGACGDIRLADYQKVLVQGYFIAIDRALKTAEEARLAKNKANADHKYDNPLPCTWENVNTLDLALDVVHYARMGLDMMQANHLFPIPYRNKKTNKYDMTLMQGYNGIKLIAENYAVEKPTAVTVELVYSNDTFLPIKKGASSNVESYEFAIENPFDRGEILGGFGYIEYADPAKNKLVMMSMKDIMKRKPAYAAAEFWGGKVKKWEGGKQVESETEGWLDEMCRKTVIREVYGAKHMPVDPKKIDDDYQRMRLREARQAELEAMAEVDEFANAIPIDPDTPPDDGIPFVPDAPPEETPPRGNGDTAAPNAPGAGDAQEPAQMPIAPNF